MLTIEHPSNARERSRMETRRRLLEAGARVFAEKGIARARAADISRAAGVAVGTLYLHFDDKEALLRELLLQGVAELGTRLRKSFETSPDSVEEIVREQVETMVRLAEDHPAVCRILFSTEVANTAIGADVLSLLAGMQEDGLRKGMARGYVRSDIDPAVAAQILVGMQMHVLSWWTRDPSVAPRELIVDTLTKVRLSGLNTASTAQGRGTKGRSRRGSI
jgi:TetR/AcrR family fatty acid metabolism transcriptional regulator